MPDIGYVNGRFSDLAEAVVPIEDRGFQFADGVYEVLVAPKRKPFRLDEHLARCRRSTDAIDLDVDYDALNLPAVIVEGIRRCEYEDVLVYLQITRGVAPRDHIFPAKYTPTVVATFKRMPVYDESLRRNGIAVETAADIRWKKCSVKSIALLPAVLIKNAARKRGFFDAIITGDDGIVRETSAANVFIVRNGTIHTPPASDAILHGVTRAYLIECAQRLSIAIEEADFPIEALLSADEVFISSTTMDVMPVTSVDGHTIGTGKPGPITGRLYDFFREMRGTSPR